MKKINNSFEILTISVLNYTDYYNSKTIFSCRYVNRYKEIERSNFNGTYYNFIASDIKEIKKDILQSIEIGNRNFIETIKKIAA